MNDHCPRKAIHSVVAGLLVCCAFAEEPVDPKVGRRLTMAALVSDLECHMHLPATDANAPVRREKTGTPFLLLRRYIRFGDAEIGPCLEARNSLMRMIVPEESFHRAYRDCQLAGNEIQLAMIWASTCKGEPNFQSSNFFSRMGLWLRLGLNFQQAASRLGALLPKARPATSPGAIPLPEALGVRLMKGEGGHASVLDRLSKWDEMTEEEKGKIIVR
jgi:hypothetical protein